MITLDMINYFKTTTKEKKTNRVCWSNIYMYIERNDLLLLHTYFLIDFRSTAIINFLVAF